MNPSLPPAEHQQRIRSSATWAAWGDAVGFICELAPNAGIVRSRAGVYPITGPVPWKRRVGGRGGPTIELPAGSISDDTQLRLATSRTIRPRIGFDAELFAKTELTVWPSYALGAGRGSREAAANLKRRDVSWATNFYSAERASYVDGGGNGAAMRIQPHVWSARPELSDSDLLKAVIYDSVCTHGHMRGILGAGFHALTLRRALEDGRPPDPEAWRRAVVCLFDVESIIQDDDELGGLWLSMWSSRANTTLRDGVAAVVRELEADIRAVENVQRNTLAAEYDAAVEALEAFRPEQRGSGTKTALLASFLAWRAREDPATTLLVAANRIGTDTDSIATMAGSILGGVGGQEPEGPLIDREYIRHEADRMWAIAQGLEVPAFPHPDLRRWAPPRSQSDVLGSVDGGLSVAGLGPCIARSEKLATSETAAASWQWVDLWFGQRILVKRRDRPPDLEMSQRVEPAEGYLTLNLLDGPLARPAAGHDSIHAAPARPSGRDGAISHATVHEMTDQAIAKGFDPELIGRHLLALADHDDGVELAVAYTAILAKARLSRRDRDRRATATS